MKLFQFLLTITLLNSGLLFAQGQSYQGFTTSGNKILDPCGNVFIPRGVNYALLDDWDFPGNMNSGELSSQIIQANPNTVRIQWYVDYGQPSRPTYTLSDLDSVISRFERAGIVSIVDMHDVTCTNNYSGFMDIVQYWTMPEMVALIFKHQKSMMLNLANEYGQVEWTANPATSYTEWVNDNISGIDSIRNAGIQIPIIIDAPDCAISINRLLDAASDFNMADTLHNIILSDHAYYSTYSAMAMADLANQAASSSIPLIFGEIANIQDATGPCSDTITNYKVLLWHCEQHDVGWLAWVWTDDICAGRRVSSDGMFSNLTEYGEVIVNDTTFGLMGHAQKACFEEEDTGTAIQSVFQNKAQLILYPNPTNYILTVKIPSNWSINEVEISFWTVLGRQIKGKLLTKNKDKMQFDIRAWATGIYRVKCTNGQILLHGKVVKY